MALITDIVRPLRGSKRAILHIDHYEWRTTSADVVRSLGLKTGHIEPESELAEHIDAAEASAARDRALRMLAYRDRSVADLTRRLVEDGYPSEVASTVAGDLERVGIMDDERFASSLSRVLSEVRGLGRERILRELGSAGVDDALALAVLDEAAPTEDEFDRALRFAIANTGRTGTDPGRLASKLVRKGFAPSTALRAARSAMDARDDDTSEEVP